MVALKGRLTTVQVAGVIALSLLCADRRAFAGDCTPSGALPNSCWNFAAGYQLTLAEAGVPDGEYQRWHYQVLRTGTKSTANYFLMGFETKNGPLTGVEVQPPPLSNYGQSFPACQGDSGTTIGLGDCLRQYFRWTPNANSALTDVYVYTKPVARTGNVLMGLKVNSSQETGLIAGPVSDNAQTIETTNYCVSDDRGVRICFDGSRGGTDGIATACRNPFPADPAYATYCDDSSHFVTVPGFALNQAFGCLPPTTDHPANATLTFGGGASTSLHCGEFQFMNDKASFQIKNYSSCTVVLGKLRCF